MKLQDIRKNHWWKEEFFKELKATKSIVEALLNSGQTITNSSTVEVANKISEIIYFNWKTVTRDRFSIRLWKELWCKAQSADLLKALWTDSETVNRTIYKLKIRQHQK